MTMESLASTDKTPRFSVLIVAGGAGTRLGGPLPKQYQTIGNFTVLEQSIRTFLSCETVNQIRLVCDPSHVNLVHDTLTRYNLPSPAASGNTRKDSVYNGLLSFPNLKDDEVILVHDAARPLVSKTDIEALVKAVNKCGAATLACPIADTLRRGAEIIDRNGLWAIQTPQGFRAGILREAHQKFKDRDDFTDDSGMVTALGHDVALIPGNRRNFKITTADDLELARDIMSTPETRSALGFDVHAFDPVKPGPIRLGGVDIPFDRNLMGHSDADVGLHAITDALLGSIAAGDIGTHFPPSDPQWKGADSTIFLAHAVKLLHEKNAVITFIDLTFMCEAPKIGPHRDAMQQVIARITGISPDRVSIKATTTEKLGFTGRGEGIAAQALVTIQISALQSAP